MIWEFHMSLNNMISYPFPNSQYEPIQILNKIRDGNQPINTSDSSLRRKSPPSPETPFYGDRLWWASKAVSRVS